MVKVSVEQGESFIEALTGCNRIQPAPKSLITAKTFLKKTNNNKKMAALMKVLILSWKVLNVALVALFNVTQPLKDHYSEAEGKKRGVNFL